VKYAQQAFDHLPEGDHYRRGALTALLGLAYWASGDLEAAHRAFSDGLARAGDIQGIIHGSFVVADIKMTLGHLREALRTCERALRLAAEQGEPMPVGVEDVYSGLSELHRERGDLQAAAQALAMSRKLGELAEIPDWQYRWCIAQARLKATLGDLASAADLLDEAERLYVRTPLPDVRPIAALRARVWVRQGRLTEALDWARERDLSVNDHLSFLREFEHVTLARVLIARYKMDRVESAIHQAVQLSERLLIAAEEGGRQGSVIELLVLQALAFEALGDVPRALAPLERALTLAEPEGYVRIFVNEGPPMAELLRKMKDEGGRLKEYVHKLLTASGKREPHPSSFIPQPLIEPLREREMEVLQLIAEGLTNQEIATRLYISLNTVKVHTRNIYGKLDVHHRTGAVAKARTLGILSAN
jgi:LuxR family maltose regulon positive regulatory protein